MGGIFSIVSSRNMSFLQIVFCCFTIYDIAEGRLVLGKIGENVSFSWTFNSDGYDAIHILHNTSRIYRFYPDNNPSVPRELPDRVSISVVYSTSKNVTVTINLLNITENDSGAYRVVQQWDSKDLDDGVDLQITGITHYTTTATFQNDYTEGINHYTTMVTTLNEDIKEISYYKTAAMSWTDDTEGINQSTTANMSLKEYTEGSNHYTNAAMIPELDGEDFPSKYHLMYIVLGMGAIVAAAVLACLLLKIRLCLSINRVSNDNTLTDSDTTYGGEILLEENLAGNYWTIVSNERGELSTAMERDFERFSEPSLIVQDIVPTRNELEQCTRRPENITINDELDGYLNPIHSCPLELDDYIHPIHSDPVN